MSFLANDYITQGFCYQTVGTEEPDIYLDQQEKGGGQYNRYYFSLRVVMQQHSFFCKKRQLGAAQSLV